MPSYFKYQIVDEADAIDENGCLKDKHSVRVSMRDALASRNQRMMWPQDKRCPTPRRECADYMEAQRKNFYNKPGYRTGRGLLGDQSTKTAGQHALLPMTLQKKPTPKRGERSAAEILNRVAARSTGQRGWKPGDPCTLNGASGVLGYNEEGELVCQVQSSNDDPEKALSDAYRDHENYLNHAWRMK